MFDAHSATLILSGTARRRGAWPEVYIRRIDESKYVRVTDIFRAHTGAGDDGELMIRSWVATATSKLHCIISEVGPEIDDKIRPIIDHGLLTLDLLAGDCTHLTMAECGLSGLVVSELIGASADGQALYGIAGSSTPESAGRVLYKLVQIVPSTRTIKEIIPFENISF